MNDIGLFLSISGTLISLYGVYLLNILHEWKRAMLAWAVSNPVLLAYFCGSALGIWDGQLPLACMVVLYGVFTATNWYGIVAMRGGADV